MPEIFNPVHLRPEAPSQDDLDGSPYPLIRFAPTFLRLWSKDGKGGLRDRGMPLDTRYDVGVGHASSEFLMHRGYDEPRVTPLVQVDESDADWCGVYVRGVEPAVARVLKGLGYVKDAERPRTYCASIEPAALSSELRRLVERGFALGGYEWTLLGDAPERRLAWRSEDAAPWVARLREQPRDLTDARAGLAEALRLSERTYGVVHVSPRHDGTLAVHQGIAEHGCGMVALKADMFGVHTYLPVQDWLAGALQHELVRAVADFFDLGADFTTSKRYAELRW